jgi:hypothetical protein
MFDEDEDNLAYKNGWLVLAPGEAYEKRFTVNSAVYIFRTNTSWIIWRAFWVLGNPKPKSEKKLSSHRTFSQAFLRAQSYVEWRMNNHIYKKASGG